MSFWDIPDPAAVRDASTRTILAPIRQNLMLLMGKFGSDNYGRAATIQDLVDYGVLGIDRGSLYSSSAGVGGTSNAASAAADRAQTSATSASGSASSASASASSALSYSTNSLNSATNASNSALLAQDWASKAEDSVVQAGKYSALHYAAKADDSAIAAAASAQDALDALTLTETTAKTDNYTIDLADLNKVILLEVTTTGKSVTVPTNTAEPFDVGSVVHIYNNSADDVDIVGDTGVTVRNAGLLSQHQEARLRKRAANEWVLTIY